MPIKHPVKSSQVFLSGKRETALAKPTMESQSGPEKSYLKGKHSELQSLAGYLANLWEDSMVEMMGKEVARLETSSDPRLAQRLGLDSVVKMAKLSKILASESFVGLKKVLASVLEQPVASTTPMVSALSVTASRESVSALVPLTLEDSRRPLAQLTLERAKILRHTDAFVVPR